MKQIKEVASITHKLSSTCAIQSQNTQFHAFCFQVWCNYVVIVPCKRKKKGREEAPKLQELTLWKMILPSFCL